MEQYTYISTNIDNRIIRKTTSDYKNSSFGILVNNIPDGDIMDYKYINNQYVYDPLPKFIKPSKPQPSLEERVSDCELMLADIIGGAV